MNATEAALDRELADALALIDELSQALLHAWQYGMEAEWPCATDLREWPALLRRAGVSDGALR